jgi:hypothetical protein
LADESSWEKGKGLGS